MSSRAPEGEETDAGDIGRSRSASSAILEESAKLQRLARKASLASFSSSTPRACVKDWYPCNQHQKGVLIWLSTIAGGNQQEVNATAVNC